MYNLVFKFELRRDENWWCYYCFMVKVSSFKYLDLILGSQRVLFGQSSNNLEYRLIYGGEFHYNLIHKSFLFWPIHWDRVWPINCLCMASKLRMEFVCSYFLRVGGKNKDEYVTETLYDLQNLEYLLSRPLQKKFPSTWMRTWG